ncbi:family 63 glycoside hydrolase [Aspergillus steynii IBT 23096]|uniref:Mannosyl-oligosaccharide glucosidase n=1 Tax=Aspergillus steynii IBT 23096 TaxID=1392250 RepID=A0A2I2GSK6_9EURO|nr:family 63 glycoside hydrolase [Aspergillus steynii IBT 23096]PLB55845.1 family 63 glycoside hydrolase [Aspergillus steynii IBT 23096]
MSDISEFVASCNETKRLQQDHTCEKHWKKWGPYVAERQWGTVREDYSEDGDAWSHFPHDHARKRAYRWGEDGIAGVSDDHGFQNIAFAFWNGIDPFLKERLFGLSNSEGVHGESVKEVYFHLDNVPSHSYMKYLYKYPQREFPYDKLVRENANRSVEEPEYSLVDTEIFEADRYWDIFIEVAKEGDDEEELIFRVVAYNRGPEPAPLHIVPQIWFRNTWGWGRKSEHPKPTLAKASDLAIVSDHLKLERTYLLFSPSPGTGADTDDVLPEFLFTENDTNSEALSLGPNPTPHVKDAFHRYIVDGQSTAVNAKQTGTKSAVWYAFDNPGVPPGECAVVRFRLSKNHKDYIDEEELDNIIEQRKDEADDFYYKVNPRPMSDDLRNIQRQAFASILWSKQHYYFVWDHWINGDPVRPVNRRNIDQQWRHMHLDDIFSVRDSWEYPFSSAWDSGFSGITLAMIDPQLAKDQLLLCTSERYMHPNGQLPGYERNFGDSSPPVQAWSAFRIFKIERKMYGRQDLDFLELMFEKLLINFTWWVNRKDLEGKNLFEGGYLGLDNIGIFSRSDPLPTGGVLEQADSTGWMAFYCLSMLNISLELAKHRRIYESMASKFFEHFVLISDAMRNLWNEEDGFYYDAISWGAPWSRQLPIRSLVGLIPLYATLTLEPEIIDRFPKFKRQLEWYIENRQDMAERNIASMTRRGKGDRLLLALVSKPRLVRILSKMLDEEEFLSKYGIRSLSRHHEKHPYLMGFQGKQFKIGYTPGHANSRLFGGNSNWRGPIWTTANFLLNESLLRFFMFYGTELKVECPTDSGDYLHLGHVAEELNHRFISLFTRDDEGRRPSNAGDDRLDFDEHWKDYLWLHEFFDGDKGCGFGANHHSAWSSLIAKVIHSTSITVRLSFTPRTPFAMMHYYFDEVFHKRNFNSVRSIPSPIAEDKDELGFPVSQNKDKFDQKTENKTDEIDKKIDHQVASQLDGIRISAENGQADDLGDHRSISVRENTVWI